MKTCIVTLCKDEDNFLDEWINYNLKLGFDKIFIIDNNPSERKLKIDNAQVTIIPYNDIQFDMNWANVQLLEGYNYGLQYVKKLDYDYITIIDADEFITLNTYKDINDFIFYEMVIPQKNVCELVWVTYSDNNLIYENDLISNSVLENYTTPCDKLPIKDKVKYTTSQNSWGKCIVKNLPELTYTISPHHPDWKDKHGNVIYTSNRINRKVAYIKHFRTKCLETYIKHKVHQTKCYKGFYGVINDILEFFFMFNDVTIEKLNAYQLLCKKYRIPYSQEQIDSYLENC